MQEKLSILLVRPYLSGFFDLYHPPLGIITLAGQVFERLGREKCQIEILDLNIGKRSEVQFEKILRSMDKSPAIVGFSTLTREDHKTRSLAQVVRRIFPDTIIALGGPIAWADPMAKANESFYDWVFYGEADYSFPSAVDRILHGSTDLTGIPGIIWRQQQEGKRSDRYVDNGVAGCQVILCGD